MPEKSLITFPCDFQIKVIGEDTIEFVELIKGILNKHFPDFCSDNLRQSHSKQNTYVSLTVTVHALNQSSLDSLYQALSSQPEVKMVL